jgi:hypothetical protein
MAVKMKNNSINMAPNGRIPAIKELSDTEQQKQVRRGEKN